ncbi:MAG: D-arabinono-1,4-lactone oxidase, partial [Cyclobacteriaceae bacterium]
YLYEFESGIKIHELNEALEKDKLALDNMGTYQGQSFIGAASTGTHGSGIELGALPEMIRSICIVSEGGLVFRIEPKTDYLTKKGRPVRRLPKLGRKEFPEGARTSLQNIMNRGDLTVFPEDRDVYLIQNDEWFNAAKLNVGCFGIVYSLIIEVGNYHDIIETIEFTTWADLKGRLNANDPELFVSKNIEGLGEDILKGIETDDDDTHKIRHMEILVNPYPDKIKGTNTGKHFCRVTRRYRSYHTEDIKNCMKRGRVPSNTKAWVARESINMIAEGATVEKNKHIDWFLNSKVLFRAAHAVRKPSPRRSGTLMERAMKPGGYLPVEHLGDLHYNDEYHYRNRNWYVFPAGGDKIGGYGAEMALSFGKKPGDENRTFVNAVDKLLEIAALALQEGGHAQTVPYSLRFVAASKAHLSPQYSKDGTPTCMIELLNVYDTVGGKEMLRRYQLAMLEMGGRPHWGLDMNVMSGKYLEKGLYPKHKEWKQVYDVLNAYGTFDNAFTHRMAWSIV